MTKIDLGAIWQDGMAIGRRNAELVVPIAGMFLLLPALLSQWLVPPIDLPQDLTMKTFSHAMNAYVGAYWPYMLAHMAVTGIGSLAILALLLRPERPTVAHSLRLAAQALPVYLLATLIQSLMLTVGFMLFIVPGLYLVGRTVLMAPVAAVEGGTNPINIITRSFAATRGNGWRIFALLAVILITGFILQSVLLSVLALLMRLLVSAEIATIVLGIAGGLISALIALMTLLVGAALYRRLTVLPLVPHTH